MIHYSEDKRMLEYGLMKSYPGIFCFSTTRHGGYSTGEYASFNCNNYCGDVMENILKNRSLLCSLLPGTEKELVIPHQVHRAEVRVVDREFCKQPESLRASLLEGVDALVTDVPGKCICVSTADCVPVMCFDTKQGVVAAIHAGWRGTVARIITETLQVMNRTYGTQGKDVVACIGPSISLEAFEVGDEVYTCFEPIKYRAKWYLYVERKCRFFLGTQARYSFGTYFVRHYVEIGLILTYICLEAFVFRNNKSVYNEEFSDRSI